MQMKIKKNKEFVGWSDQDKQFRKKAIALFEHLLLNPNFIKEVKKFRMKHNIPNDGFQTDEAYLQWLESHKPPIARVKVIEELITLDVNDKPETKQREVIQEVSTYRLDLCDILKKFNLSLEWYPYVNSYICRNSQVKLNPHEIDLVRHTCHGLIIQEEIRFKFGATMNVEYLTKKFLGQSIWANAVKPLQQLMQGCREKTKRPSKDKMQLKVKILQLSNSGKTDKEIFNESEEIESLEALSQLRCRFKKQIDSPKT